MTVCMACSLRGWDFLYSERDSENSERRGPKDRAGPVHAVVKPRDLYRGHAKRVDRREGGAPPAKGHAIDEIGRHDEPLGYVNLLNLQHGAVLPQRF